MKTKILFITSLVLITSVSFSQSKVNINNLVQYGDKMFEENDDKSYTGIVFDLDKSTGNKVMEGRYKDGLEDGKWILWYKDGQKNIEKTYKNGKEEGQFTRWYKNGNLEVEGFRINDTWDGEFTEWYENGNKKEEGTWELTKYDDGYNIGYYNQKIGKWTSWYKNGEKKLEETYKNGKEEGQLTRWYENGNLEVEGLRINDTWDGEFTEWYENGDVKEETIFENGRIVEQLTHFIDYYSNGQIKEKGILKNKKKVGVWTSWELSGSTFGYFIGIKIKSNELLNYNTLNTIKVISTNLNSNYGLFSLLTEVFYQNNDGFFEIKNMLSDLNRLQLSTTEQQQIIEHTQERESLKNIFFSLNNNYTTILISSNVLSSMELEHIKNTIEQYNTDHIELSIYVPSQIQLEGDIKSPEVLKYIGEIEHFLQNNYNIEYSLSFSDYLKDIHCVIMGNDPKYRIIPDSKIKIERLLKMYSMSGDPDDFSHLVNYDFSKTNILFYLPDKSIIKSGEMELGMENFLNKSLIENYKIVTHPINENRYKNYEGTWKDGIKVGKWIHWNEDGRKMREGTWKDGIKVGKWIHWNEDGRKMIEGTYKGLWTYWYTNGKKWKEGTLKDSKEDGKWIFWYENGQKGQEGSFKDGKRDGFFTYWYKNGQKESEKTFKDGEMISRKEWNKDGSVKN